MQRLLLPLCLAVAACGEPATVANRAAETNAGAPADVVTPAARPVRIGELGANFAACSAAGTTRKLAAGEALPVRVAPFDNAPESGSVAAAARFFICTRSHDQRWFAIVWHEADGASRSCGVSVPATVRRDYDGPCRSGWIPSAPVRLESGILHEVPTQANSSG